MPDCIQYKFLFSFGTYADPEPGAETSTLRLQLRLWPKVPAPWGSCSTTLLFFYHKKNAPGPLSSTLVYFRI
jgi:hypothetical protein